MLAPPRARTGPGTSRAAYPPNRSGSTGRRVRSSHAPRSGSWRYTTSTLLLASGPTAKCASTRLRRGCRRSAGYPGQALVSGTHARYGIGGHACPRRIESPLEPSHPPPHAGRPLITGVRLRNSNTRSLGTWVTASKHAGSSGVPWLLGGAAMNTPRPPDQDAPGPSAEGFLGRQLSKCVSEWRSRVATNQKLSSA
ncbi:hypothetical protein OH76DRAFT_784209 [Lentinus brumalis]|uniref:Uncharacterized protein n=1 Tax=Lentinus brumalis TaxID=2498619 RepID=A0A371D3V7_9APHY|nr:hypothetical protein OH76DRAFT_784209 [Polyporus brumalis]